MFYPGRTDVVSKKAAPAAKKVVPQTTPSKATPSKSATKIAPAGDDLSVALKLKAKAPAKKAGKQ
jgi:hypothetical protein